MFENTRQSDNVRPLRRRRRGRRYLSVRNMVAVTLLAAFVVPGILGVIAAAAGGW
jgi:hypothetical protein